MAPEGAELQWSGLTTNALLIAEKVREGWYKPSEDVETFDSSVQKLQAWENVLEKHKIADLPALKLSLQEANKKLESEIQRARTIQCSRSCWKSFRVLAFPKDLALSIQRVADTFENIPGVPQEGGVTAAVVLDESEHALPSKVHFSPDRKYVPPTITVAAVEQALDDDGGPQVVVVYGQPGTGKSNLAKYLGLKYQGVSLPKTFERSMSPRPTPAMSPANPVTPLPRRSFGFGTNPKSHVLRSENGNNGSSPGTAWPFFRRSVGTRPSRENKTLRSSASPGAGMNPGLALSPGGATLSVVQPSRRSLQLPPNPYSPKVPRKRFPYGVFYLDCGKGVDVQSKQLELLKILGFPFPMTKEEDQQHSHLSFSGPTCHKALSEQLKTQLDKQKALIILDDVWEADLVEKLMVPGVHVKFLVTSQNSELWRGAKTIQIERLNLEDARKILANHVGLSYGVIPESLEEVADKFVEASNYNPLALANMAIVIKASQTPHGEETDQWEEVLRDFSIYLGSQEDRPGPLDDKGYLDPCRASMMLAVESMPQEALELLILTAACEGPYVPEVVIRLLFQSINGPGGLSKFSKWKTYLGAWSLISIQDQFQSVTQDSSDHLPFFTWSIHGFRKEYLREEKQDSINSFINSLMNDNKHCKGTVGAERLLAALCVLNGEPTLAQRAAEKLGISTDRRDYKRNIIEPFVSMLHPGAEEEWKQRSNRLATQVILRFVCAGELDDEAISNLLEIRQVADTVCMAMCVFGENPSLRRLSVALEMTVKAVLKLLGGSTSVATQRVALDAFIAVTQFNTDRQSSNMMALAASPEALQCLEHMLGDSKDPIWQCRAAGVLGNLSNYHEMAVRKLMVMLANDKSERVQRGATSAFASLALGEENKPKMAASPGALETLVGLLCREVPESVQRYAAVALANLATAPENRAKMADFPGALGNLVGLLSEDIPESVQRYAAWALANLAVADENQIKMASFPGMLQKLVGRLAKSVPESVQHQSARALANLTSAYENLVAMAAFPETLEKFVELLAKDVPVHVQEHVSRAFASLASADENKIKMVAFPNALPRLVGLLNREVAESVQHFAAWAIANLAWADENRSRIASHPKALEMLVGLLARDVPENIQQHATRAFANLAWAHENKAKMAFLPGALEKLGGLLARDVPENIQQHAVIALAKLAMADENRVKMATFPGLLERLVGLLAKDVPENVQRYAAWAFANLAWESENKTRMAAYPRAIERLVGLLSEEVNESVQRQAARALTIVEWKGKGGSDLMLKSAEALIGRGSVKLQQGFYKEALVDFNRANELRPGHEEILWLRAFALVKSTKDYRGALVDLNKAIQVAPHEYLSWQERGVLKHLMGDYAGALADLNKAMEISANNYEILKHRGYVKHVLKDDIGARADGEKAILFRPMRVDSANYGNTCLGVQPVEFLTYKLK